MGVLAAVFGATFRVDVDPATRPPDRQFCRVCPAWSASAPQGFPHGYVQVAEGLEYVTVDGFVSSSGVGQWG